MVDSKISRACRYGFTLIEVVIALLIVGILTAIAAPKVFDVVEEAKIRATTRDLRGIEEAAALHLAEKGEWPETRKAWNPPDPDPFEDYLAESLFEKEPPGVTSSSPYAKYSWYNLTWRYLGEWKRFVYIYAPDDIPTVWAKLDEQLDDGAANTGSIRILYGGHALVYGVD